MMRVTTRELRKLANYIHTKPERSHKKNKKTILKSSTGGRGGKKGA